MKKRAVEEIIDLMIILSEIEKKFQDFDDEFNIPYWEGIIHK